jgi:hypothetical protein
MYGGRQGRLDVRFGTAHMSDDARVGIERAQVAHRLLCLRRGDGRGHLDHRHADRVKQAHNFAPLFRTKVGS